MPAAESAFCICTAAEDDTLELETASIEPPPMCVVTGTGASALTKMNGGPNSNSVLCFSCPIERYCCTLATSNQLCF